MLDEEEWITQCLAHAKTRYITVIYGIKAPTAEGILLASQIAQTIQALLLGSCLQLVYFYYISGRRDSTRAKAGIAILTLLATAHVCLCNYQTSQVVAYSDRYLAVSNLDWWLINFEFLNATIVSLPIHVYFVRRACLLWNRSIWVWWPCIVLTAVAHILFGTSCLMGLHAPWGFKLLSDTEIMRWLPVFGDQVWQTWPVRLAGVYSLLVLNAVICALICYGVFRRRNGLSDMDTSISRITFLCGESLVALVLISILDTVGVAAVAHDSTSVLIGRFTAMTTPLLQFHALVGTLVSRDKIANILAIDPDWTIPSGVCLTPATTDFDRFTTVQTCESALGSGNRLISAVSAQHNALK